MEKEKAILERFLERVEAGLHKIARTLEQGTLKDSGQANGAWAGCWAKTPAPTPL